MKKSLFILGACLAFTQVEALLPPLYQSAAEIKAILEDKELGEKLTSGESIKKIKKNKQGYEIVTNHHRLQVSVIYETAQQPGPAQFKINFENAVPSS